MRKSEFPKVKKVGFQLGKYSLHTLIHVDPSIPSSLKKTVTNDGAPQSHERQSSFTQSEVVANKKIKFALDSDPPYENYIP